MEEFNPLRREQFGFQRSTGTIDAAFTHNTGLAAEVADNRKIYVTMVDFNMAFDRVGIPELLQRLRNKGLPLELLRIIGSMYHNYEARVKTRKGISTKFPINAGVKLLSCLYIESFLEELDKPHLNNNSKGLRVGEKTVKAILYADDMALVTTDI